MNEFLETQIGAAGPPFTSCVTLGKWSMQGRGSAQVGTAHPRCSSEVHKDTFSRSPWRAAHPLIPARAAPVLFPGRRMMKIKI